MSEESDREAYEQELVRLEAEERAREEAENQHLAEAMAADAEAERAADEEAFAKHLEEENEDWPGHGEPGGEG